MSRMTLINPQELARLRAYLSQVQAPVADPAKSLTAVIDAHQAEIARLRNMGYTQHEIAKALMRGGVRRSERTIVRALSRHCRAHSRKHKTAGAGIPTARQGQHADHTTEKPAAKSAEGANTQRSKFTGLSINLDD